jgi:hypothetical protein
MTNTTPAALNSLALLDSGVIGQGQIASGEDVNNAFTRGNMMLAQWARKRWLVWNLTDVAFVSTGAISYTVGIGENFNISRPARLEDGCFMRQLNTTSGQAIDFTPLRLLTSHEDYARIAIKGMGTFASVVFYDSAWPVASVFFWPVPQASIYELHILVKTPISQFTSLNQVVNMPDEYQAAYLYNLQARLRAAYRLPPDPVIIALAKESLNVIRVENTQIPTMRMPSRLTNRGYGYNVYSDSN